MSPVESHLFYSKGHIGHIEASLEAMGGRCEAIHK